MFTTLHWSSPDHTPWYDIQLDVWDPLSGSTGTGSTKTAQKSSSCSKRNADFTRHTSTIKNQQQKQCTEERAQHHSAKTAWDAELLDELMKCRVLYTGITWRISITFWKKSTALPPLALHYSSVQMDQQWSQTRRNPSRDGQNNLTGCWTVPPPSMTKPIIGYLRFRLMRRWMPNQPWKRFSKQSVICPAAKPLL